MGLAGTTVLRRADGIRVPRPRRLHTATILQLHPSDLHDDRRDRYDSEEHIKTYHEMRSIRSCRAASSRSKNWRPSSGSARSTRKPGDVKPAEAAATSIEACRRREETVDGFEKFRRLLPKKFSNFARQCTSIEAAAVLEDGCVGTAAVPSGASTGEKEAVELRDGETRPDTAARASPKP